MEVVQGFDRNRRSGEIGPQERVQRCVAWHFVAVPGPRSLKENVEVVSWVLHEQISERSRERIIGVPVPQVAEQFVARFAEHIVAVPVPRILKDNVEVAKGVLAPPRVNEYFVALVLLCQRLSIGTKSLRLVWFRVGKFLRNFCEPRVEVPVPQVADQFGALFVVVPVPHRVFLTCFGRCW